MASISTDSKGLRRILFADANGQRRQIRLGRVPIKTARTIKGHVENLVAAALGCHSPDPETSAWAGDLKNKLHDKLVAVGLVSPREAKSETHAVTLGELPQTVHRRPKRRETRHPHQLEPSEEISSCDSSARISPSRQSPPATPTNSGLT